MKVQGYIKNSYKNRIEFCSDEGIAARNLWAISIYRSKIKNLVILDETVLYLDNIKNNRNRIGRACVIEM